MACTDMLEVVRKLLELEQRCFFSKTWPSTCCSSRNESCDTVVVLSACEEVEQAAAERMVARRCAQAHIHARGRARRGSSKHSAIDCAHPPARLTARLTGGVNRTNLMKKEGLF